MIRPTNTSHRLGRSVLILRRLSLLAALAALGACTNQSSSSAAGDNGLQTGDARMAQILAGRTLVLNHDCGGCHGGGSNPAHPYWLSGARTKADEFTIGPFTTRPRNITPDNQTGIGRFTERQIFNALRYGLRPGETPDVEITSFTPGQGNFPLHPRYLAPPMPWTGWRYMSDKELYAIAAYLKNGLKPVNHFVADSEGPPDFWASVYVADSIGTYPAASFPTARERGR
jgi:hypothetical protein